MDGAYLIAALALNAVCFLVWLGHSGQRRTMLLSGMLLAPFGFLGYVFVPIYWNPRHLFTIIPGVGIEDFLFCFACGGLSWALATWPKRWEVCQRMRKDRLLFRYVAMSLASGVLSWGCCLAGAGIMSAAILGFGMVGLLQMGSGRWRLAVAGGTGFAAIYTVFLAATLVMCPEAIAWWRIGSTEQRGMEALLSAELAWAISFGAVWPVLIATLVDGRVVS